MNGRQIYTALILFIFAEITLANNIFDGTYETSETVTVNRRFVDSEYSVLNSFVDISAYQCYTECTTRPRCKAVEYKYRTKYCRLFSDVGDHVTAPGSLIITGFNENGSCGDQACQDTEVCATDTETCRIAECGYPSQHPTTTGNMYAVGSKAKYSCAGVPESIICNDDGTWYTTKQVYYAGLTCTDIKQHNNQAQSGHFINEEQMSIYCDFDTDGGNWLVIQRRSGHNDVDFYRSWDEYKEGFGDVCGDFWLGLENVRKIIDWKESRFELRIDMKTWDDTVLFAHYEYFKVLPESTGYRLFVGDYNGTAGDGLRSAGYNGQNIARFSTYDADNDDDSYRNCAHHMGGGWWYDKCYPDHTTTSLNGRLHGIQWVSPEERLLLRNVSMKIREKM